MPPASPSRTSSAPADAAYGRCHVRLRVHDDDGVELDIEPFEGEGCDPTACDLTPERRPLQRRPVEAHTLIRQHGFVPGERELGLGRQLHIRMNG